MNKNYFVVGVFLVLVFWLSRSGDVWKGFYYPDGCLSCEDKYIFSPEFKTKEECFDWAYALKTSRDNPDDLFECGLNCKEKGGFSICEETVD